MEMKQFADKFITVMTTSGNPDFNQYAPISEPAILVADSMEELREQLRDYQNFWQVGGGNFMNPAVLYNLKPVGHFSYNGRLWDNRNHEDATDVDETQPDWFKTAELAYDGDCMASFSLSGNPCKSPWLFYATFQSGGDLKVCFEHVIEACGGHMKLARIIMQTWEEQKKAFDDKAEYFDEVKRQWEE
tara:strand:+ start:319 stop:882 length:564 start_codon:yes stop_codon:yes gene_type:complete